MMTLFAYESQLQIRTKLLVWHCYTQIVVIINSASLSLAITTLPLLSLVITVCCCRPLQGLCRSCQPSQHSHCYFWRSHLHQIGLYCYCHYGCHYHLTLQTGTVCVTIHCCWLFSVFLLSDLILVKCNSLTQSSFFT